VSKFTVPEFIENILLKFNNFVPNKRLHNHYDEISCVAETLYEHIEIVLCDFKFIIATVSPYREVDHSININDYA
jgi:predicted transcriptional regulator YheO